MGTKVGPATQKPVIYEEPPPLNDPKQKFSKTTRGGSKQTVNQTKEVFRRSSGISGTEVKNQAGSAQKTYTDLNKASSIQKGNYASDKQKAREQMKNLSDKVNNKPEMLEFPNRYDLADCVNSHIPFDPLLWKFSGPLISQFADQKLTSQQVNQEVHKKSDEISSSNRYSNRIGKDHRRVGDVIKERMNARLPEVFEKCAKGQFGSGDSDDDPMDDLDDLDDLFM